MNFFGARNDQNTTDFSIHWVTSQYASPTGQKAASNYSRMICRGRRKSNNIPPRNSFGGKLLHNLKLLRSRRSTAGHHLTESNEDG